MARPASDPANPFALPPRAYERRRRVRQVVVFGVVSLLLAGLLAYSVWK
jgi:hypothetical protein